MEKRERWSSRPAFVMAAIGSAIGLGNLWRFPYLCYNYGGGAFLIPWIVGLIVLGIPWFILELGISHWMQKGAPGSLAKVGKKWEWAGWWPVFVSSVLNIYYVVIMAWALCYLFHSCWLAWGAGPGVVQTVNPFFYQTFLGLTENPGVWGDFRWPIVGALAFSWAVIFLILYKGVRRVGKVALYTVTIPWICLIILTIRGLTLPGAVEGLNYYLTPDFSALLNGEVWFGAFSQIAFTLSLGMGIMFAYGSYIPKDSDITNNAMITSFANCATSFFAGFAVFSIIGFLAQALGVSVQAVTESGIALTFITFPTAISMMPFIPQIIGIVLFLCIWMLGIDSAFSISEAMITGVVDKFRISKAKATAVICIVSFVVGTFLFCRGSGLYWLDMIDRAVAFYGLLLAGLVECIIIGWVFGADKVREHVNSVSDFKIGKWFDWLIKVILPAALAYVIAWGLKSDIPVYGNYPVWASTIGVWGVLLLTLVLALIFGFVIKGKGSEEKKVKEVEERR